VDVEHVQCLIDDRPHKLTREQCKQAIAFIHRNVNVFSRSEFDIGRTELVEHSIETAAHMHLMLPQINEYIQQMQDNGFIEPRLGSEGISNIVLVRKKDESLCYCIDCRSLNAVMTKAKYPLPCIDACHDSYAGILSSHHWICELGTGKSPSKTRTSVTKVTQHLVKPVFASSMDSTSVGATSEETIVV